MARKKTKAKTETPPNSVGRPTLYKPEYCTKLIAHMKQGGSFEGFGGIVGVSKQTLYAWTEEYPEFLDAKEIGWSASLLWWENIGKDNLIMEEGTKFNASVWNKNMQNRFDWREKKDTNQNVTISPHQYLTQLIEQKKLEESDDE